MPRDMLEVRLALLGPWPEVAEAGLQSGSIIAAAWTTVLARLQQSGVPWADAAWMMARFGVALFLLAAAGHAGHPALLSRMMGQ